MKKDSTLCVFAIIVIISFAAISTPAQEKVNIAVAEFEARNVSQMDAATISDFLRTELVKSGIFNILERSNMAKLLAEQRFQQTGCVTTECAIEMGRLLGVQKIVIGTVSRLAGAYYISANVVDIETGRIVVAEKVKCTEEAELDKETEKLGKMLVSYMRGEKLPVKVPEEIPKKIFCTNCGKEVSMEDEFCPYCGAQILKPEMEEKRLPPSEEQRVTPLPQPVPVKMVKIGQEGEIFYTYQRVMNIDDIYTYTEEVKQTLFTLYLRIPLGEKLGLLFHDTYRSFTSFYEDPYYGGYIKEEYAWAQNFLQSMLYVKIFEGSTPEGNTKFDWLIAGGAVWLTGAYANPYSADNYTKTDFTAYSEAKIPLGKYFTIRSFYGFITTTLYETRFNYSFYGVDSLVNLSSNLTLGAGYQISMRKPMSDSSLKIEDCKILNFSLKIRWK